MVVGMLGYLVQELARLPTPTVASDVYSIGVVVLEVTCGRKPIERWRAEDEVLLVDHGLHVVGTLLKAVDTRIVGEYKQIQMELVLKLGLSCCHQDPKQGSSMHHVVGILLGLATNASPPATQHSSREHPDRPAS
ncbi:hypothetical protein AMTRI_Chr06g176740 [Amborella trichopoda]